MSGTQSGAEADWDRETRELYARLMDAWDKRNARDYALQFTSDASLVGFDGTQVNGQLEIGAHLTEVFTHHQTPRYVPIVREVRLLTSDVTLLRANSGLIPPGKDDIDPALNAAYIVQGAVSMVDMALRELAEKAVVQLDDERRAAMVSNLMVVLCGEAEVHPVVNTGTLYA